MALVRKYLCIVTAFLMLSSHAVALPEEMANKQAFHLDMSLHRCNSERGPTSYGHEEWLKRLDRKRVVFVGDSITRCVHVLAQALLRRPPHTEKRIDSHSACMLTNLTMLDLLWYRYQYLELAYYLTYGHCPDQESDYGYILSEKLYNGWAEFFKNSSEVLNVNHPPMHTREVCLCTRLDLLPRMVSERRHFVYEDMQVRCKLFLALSLFKASALCVAAWYLQPVGSLAWWNLAAFLKPGCIT